MSGDNAADKDMSDIIFGSLSYNTTKSTSETSRDRDQDGERKQSSRHQNGGLAMLPIKLMIGEITCSFRNDVTI